MKILLAGWMAAILAISCNSVKAEASEIFEALAKNSATKVFADAIDKTGLKDELSKKQAVTVLALTDDGFNKVAEKDSLLADKDKLTAFLKSYIIEQNIDLSQIETEVEYTSLSGQSVKAGPKNQVNGLPILNEQRTKQYSIYTIDSPFPASTDVSSWVPWSYDWRSTLFNIPWLSQWMPPLKQDVSIGPKVLPPTLDVTAQTSDASKN